jgi:hypothetical protein
MIYVHSGGFFLYLAVALVPAVYLAGYVTHQVNAAFLILAVIIQFIYYFLLVSLTGIIRSKTRGQSIQTR